MASWARWAVKMRCVASALSTSAPTGNGGSVETERAELQMVPEAEEQELVAIYRSKGFTEEEARTVAHRLSADPEMALDTLVREELGLDPEELGSPWGAAGGSFAAFAIGAAVPGAWSRLSPHAAIRHNTSSGRMAATLGAPQLRNPVHGLTFNDALRRSVAAG